MSVDFVIGLLFVHDCLLHDFSFLALLIVACVSGARVYPLTFESLVLVDPSSWIAYVVWESFPTVYLRPS